MFLRHLQKYAIAQNGYFIVGFLEVFCVLQRKDKEENKPKKIIIRRV